MPITDPAFIRDVNSPQGSIVPLLLATIDHSALSTPIRLVYNNEDIISRSETFSAIDVRGASLPKQDPQELPTASIDFGDTDGSITRQLRALSPIETDRPTMKIEIVTDVDKDTVEMGPYTLQVENISYNSSGSYFTIVLSAENVLIEPFPYQRFLLSNFPALPWTFSS